MLTALTTARLRILMTDPNETPQYEVHADGVKEVSPEKCAFCSEPCTNDHCITKEGE